MPDHRFDLHTHTTFSDGTTTPEENAALARAEGLAGLALTDHDTTEGWARMEAACARQGLGFIPGLEFSTELPGTGASVHILGYWVDPEDADLVAECGRLRDERRRRAEAILVLLADLGAPVASECVTAIAGDAPVGRPHIAQAMVEAGLVADLDEAFERYLADHGPAWVPKHALAPERGVELIVAAGGAAVLAHPGSSLGPWTVAAADGSVGSSVEAEASAGHGRMPQAEVEGLLDRLCAAGLAGLEVEHPSHDEPVARHWREVAVRRDLLATGCSDFHGARKPVRMGAGTTSAGVVQSLRARAAR